jgi:sulfhydrogenase subunit alpha
MKALIPHYVAKIEGHGSLRIDFDAGKAQLQIHEGERLFEAMMVGRKYADGVFIPQRICGVCPTAHCMAAIKALEYAMDATPSETTRDLRKLMLAGQMIQSHALHLFFLVLPDYLHVDGALNLAGAAPEKFKMALDLKKAGDRIIEVVGGRAVHPITPLVGGFSEAPDAGALVSLRSELQGVMEAAAGCVRLFGSFEYPELHRPTQYLSIRADGKYGFYGGIINSNRGGSFDIGDYKANIAEEVRPYSTAKFAQRGQEGYMVGALARLNLHGSSLNPRAARELKNAPVRFPSDNSFHNNFAQAVELLHFLEEAVARIDSVLKRGLQDCRQDVRVKAGVGHGAVEAPRGTLYYTYGVDGAGRITECDIITPTVQNMSNIEADAKALLDRTKQGSRKERERLLEMLLRAYDPCITCSVH